MNAILLQPTDVLFFRDGRPMSGSLAGHTAAWPLPDVTNHALHAALHRAGLEGVHGHDHINRKGERAVKDNRKFGSLLTAGPFPAKIGSTPASGAASGAPTDASWFFPRPKDAQVNSSVQVTLKPVRSLTKDGNDHPWLGSSLPDPLKYAVANTHPPHKETGGEPWLSAMAFEAYLRADGNDFKSESSAEHFLRDDAIADQEASLGIAIDSDTQTTGQGTVEGKIYTAHYLRLREGFRLGMLAEAVDKLNGNAEQQRDLLQLLFNGHPTQIVVGGQQRVCTAELMRLQLLPLPKGLSGRGEFVALRNGRFAVKWVLLSPAV